MVSFVCDYCQEVVKKPKLDQHKQKCRNAVFSCVDCSVTFTGTSYRNHTSCISEVEKYQKKNQVLPVNQKKNVALPVGNSIVSQLKPGGLFVDSVRFKKSVKSVLKRNSQISLSKLKQLALEKYLKKATIDANLFNKQFDEITILDGKLKF